MTSPLETLYVLLLTILFLGLLSELAHFGHRPRLPKSTHRGPRPLRPRTPDDGDLRRQASLAPSPTPAQAVVP